MKNANPVSQRVLAVFLAALVCSVSPAGCGRHAPEKAPAAKPFGEVFPIGVGSQVVRMQLALSDQEKTFGLMGRRDLAPDQGMIFFFDKPDQLSFWMKNTPTPLDIGYFTKDGVLREVHQMYPFDESRVTSRRYDLQLALEVNQGWFKDRGVKPGDRIDLKALSAAVKARGVEPREVGLAVEEK